MADRESQHFKIPPIQKEVHFANGPFGLFEILMLVTMGLFCILLIASICYMRKIKYRYLSKSEITEFFKGGDVRSKRIPADINGPYKESNYELPKKCFTIDDTLLLGSGAFGKVCLGTVKRMGGEIESVAVKMTKVPCPRTALRNLLFEIKILSFLGKHPHIIELKGAYTTELKKRRTFVFLELCELGSLQGYLRKCKPSAASQPIEEMENPTTDGKYEISLTGRELDPSLANDLFRWSREIANGMEFIASKHIVHLDLATRNILLTSDKQAKITDFGLSRRMYDYQSYIKKEQEPLPWRWMAPESFRRSEFTEKSDVWAFGITLWEIFQLGDEPYPGISYNVNFPTKLERGFRLGEPTYNLNSIYSVMLRCWSINPEGRPTFTKLSDALFQDSDKAKCIPGERLNNAVRSSLDSCCSTTGDYIDASFETPPDEIRVLEPNVETSYRPKQPCVGKMENSKLPTFNGFKERLSRKGWAWAWPVPRNYTIDTSYNIDYANCVDSVSEFGSVEISIADNG